MNNYSYTNVGEPNKRIDALDKVTGSAKYTDDIKLPWGLFVKIKRSEFSYATIKVVNSTD